MKEHVELDVLDALALGTLDPAQQAATQTHLANCATCRHAYDEARSVIDVLPHALTAQPPSDELRDRIMRAIDTPAPPQRALRGRFAFPLTGALAAALVLAVIGDVYLALRATQPNGTSIAAITTPQPASPRPPAPSPRPRAVKPREAADPDARRIAALEHRLAAAQSTARTNAQQAARLAAELAQARAVPPRIVRVVITPAPQAARTVAPLARVAATASPKPIAAASPSSAPEAQTNGGPAGDAQLVAALRTGKVYAIDGVVDGEPWHLTIVQPRDGSRAVIYSGTPDAPAGETYRTWVIRSGRTVDIGELPPAKPATLDMPMAIQAGDIIAFSRERVGPADAPTQPFLMQFKVSP